MLMEPALHGNKGRLPPRTERRFQDRLGVTRSTDTDAKARITREHLTWSGEGHGPRATEPQHKQHAMIALISGRAGRYNLRRRRVSSVVEHQFVVPPRVASVGRKQLQVCGEGPRSAHLGGCRNSEIGPGEIAYRP